MYKYFWLVLVFLTAIKTYSQTASQPLELPNFIIEGKEQIDVQVGTKQMPSFPTTLSRATMDSLIIVGKPRNYIVFPITFPNTIISKKFPDGFISGNIGSFLSANISAGYKTSFKEYEIYPFGELNFSKGHLENANYTKLRLGVQTDYLAPEKFYIFGGSKTTTFINFEYKNYKLYAISSPPDRNQINFEGKIVSTGHFEGFDFNTGAILYSTNQTGGGESLGENTIGGFLEIKNRTIYNNFGGRISLDLRSFENNSAPFFETYTYGEFISGNFKIVPELGFQFAKSSRGKNRPMVLIAAKGQIEINPQLALFAKISNKLQNYSFRDFLKRNPYLDDSISLDYANISELQTNIKYQPTKDLTIVLGANLSIYKRLPTFTVSNYGYFNIEYLDATIFSINAEGFWVNEIFGRISAIAKVTSSSQNSNKKDVPLTPLLNFRTDYSRNVFDNIRTGIFFEYVGERFADVENKFSLSNYKNLGFFVEYEPNSSLIFSCNIENLLNSNIVYWYGYKEWGFNFKLGLTYKF
ncbi:MAG: TonB-dependent receptor [Ignavibacteria bacterium]|nr:TonB-dependent receptor [Ignavibacteria bacterium]